MKYPKRSWWFRCLKSFMKLFIRKSEFKYLGEEIKDGSLVISNHVGTSGPFAFEFYSGLNFRFWGTYEMNSNIFMVYKYLSKTYYHEKKHWNLFGARLFCIIAAPLAWLFYRGLRLISTYRDARFRKTIRQSMEAIKNNQS
ncbi:MAG: hypothetical protein E7345_04290 [Clostridiales bacterium]|nr:hypothetical protein [Clostridiales bacterium]